MKRIVFIYGSIAATIILANLFVGLLLAGEEHLFGAAWVGFLVMFVALTLIFVGVKRYRDSELGGVISFKTAFLLGAGIASLASVYYVLGWELYLYLTDYGFMETYTAGLLEASKAEGLSGPELEAEITRLQAMTEQYKSVLYRMPLTLVEIFPIALLFSLVSALILRKSDILPARD